MNNNKQIEEQLQAMKSAYQIASKSKASAIQFLKDAGIYQHLQTVSLEKKAHVKSEVKR